MSRLPTRCTWKADAPADKLRKIHEFVSETAPNRYNLSHAIPLESQLVIER